MPASEEISALPAGVLQTAGSRTALLGHTGFVGSNLAAAHCFAASYNSSNIEALRGQAFDLIVCSAVTAQKWQANKNPEADWAGITKLLDVLSTVAAKRFVLISTIDVYPNPVHVNEETDLSALSNHAYGLHRLRVEEFVRDKFPRHQVLRLPGLFGPGIKKNVIFDLLHDNCIEMIHPEGVFQYYSLHLLWSDICRAVEREIPLLNLATEPIATRTIVERFFPECTLEPKSTPAAKYDFRSRFAALWGGSDGYLYGTEEILAHLATFIAHESARLP